MVTEELISGIREKEIKDRGKIVLQTYGLSNIRYKTH